MKKILKLEKPIITVYPHHAHLLAMYDKELLGENFLFSWFCNNYIQLKFSPRNFDFITGYEIFTQLDNCPWLVRDSMSFDFIRTKWSSVTEFLIDAINVNYYIYVEIDEFYIEEYENYEKNHNLHTLLVFGYDEAKKEFHIADFFKNRIYYTSTVSFEMMEMAHLNLGTSFLHGVYLFKKQEEYCDFPYQRENLIRNLTDYLNCENNLGKNMVTEFYRSIPYSTAVMYGSDVYDEVKKQVAKENGHAVLNLFILKEHKEVLRYIVEQLSVRNLLDDEVIMYEQVNALLEDCIVIVNLAIKCNINYKEEYLLRLYKTMDKVKKEERMFMNTLIQKIRVEPMYTHHMNEIFYSEAHGVRKIKDYTNENIESNQITFFGQGICFYVKSKEERDYTALVDGVRKTYRSCIYPLKKRLTEVKILCEEQGLHTIRIEKELSEKYIKGYHVIRESASILNNEKSSELVYIGIDEETRGNWTGKYGTEGYVIPNGLIKYPKYGDVELDEIRTYFNKDLETSDKLLINPQNLSERIKMCYYTKDYTQFKMHIAVAGKMKRKVSFYLLDWTQSEKLIVTIKITNMITKEEISNHFELNHRGIYVSYELRGIFDIEIIYQCEPNSSPYGDFYGVFFD